MLLFKNIYFIMIFLLTFCINKHEMINVIISAIGKVTHITALPATLLAFSLLSEPKFLATSTFVPMPVPMEIATISI